MAETTVAEAIGELRQLSRLFKALDGAEKVLAVLSEGERYEKEAKQRKDGYEKEVLTLKAELANVQEEMAKAKEAAKKAKDKAAEIVQEADQRAAVLLAEVQERVSKEVAEATQVRERLYQEIQELVDLRRVAEQATKEAENNFVQMRDEIKKQQTKLLEAISA